MTVAVALMLGAACSGGDGGCDDGDDCPLMVSYGGRDYFASCAVVPRSQAGERLDVTYEEERKFGSAFGVWGYELKGVDPEEAIAIEFVQNECDDDALHLGYAEDVPNERVRELHRRLRR